MSNLLRTDEDLIRWTSGDGWPQIDPPRGFSASLCCSQDAPSHILIHHLETGDLRARVAVDGTVEWVREDQGGVKAKVTQEGRAHYILIPAEELEDKRTPYIATSGNRD